MSSLKLNEIYPSPENGGREWLEIYNPTTSVVEIRGWEIGDASGGSEEIWKSGTAEASMEGKIKAGGFLVVETTKVSLNNTGDTIYLYTPTGGLEDSVTYPSLSKKSYGRKVDGMGEWAVLGKVSPGVSNAETGTEQANGNEATVIAKENEEEIYEYNLTALEFYPCPNSGEKEWLRLQNQGTRAVNLLGFKLKNNLSSVSRNMGDVTLNAGASAKIEFTSGVAPNSGGTMLLLDPAGETVTEITYDACNNKGVTLSLNNGVWTEKVMTTTAKTTEEKEERDETSNKNETVKNEEVTNWREGHGFRVPKYTYDAAKNEEGGGIREGKEGSGSGIIREAIREGERSLTAGEAGLLISGWAVIILGALIVTWTGYKLWQEKNKNEAEAMVDY